MSGNTLVFVISSEFLRQGSCCLCRENGLESRSNSNILEATFDNGRLFSPMKEEIEVIKRTGILQGAEEEGAVKGKQRTRWAQTAVRGPTTKDGERERARDREMRG